ncbi:hypothetical protein MJO29_009705 [Puccinia striiformis f. sp. tritici]|nr:hypothetical protein MJO29_009705 [Puccinia striiformis f. sp. tritici]
MSSFSSSLSIRHPSLCFLLAREVLDLTGPHAMLGNTSLELNKIVQEACVERNSYPSPFGYFFFPRQFVMVSGTSRIE